MLKVPGPASSVEERLLRNKKLCLVRPWFKSGRTPSLFHVRLILQMHDPEASKHVRKKSCNLAIKNEACCCRTPNL